MEIPIITPKGEMILAKALCEGSGPTIEIWITGDICTEVCYPTYEERNAALREIAEHFRTQHVMHKEKWTEKTEETYLNWYEMKVT